MSLDFSSNSPVPLRLYESGYVLGMNVVEPPGNVLGPTHAPNARYFDRGVSVIQSRALVLCC